MKQTALQASPVYIGHAQGEERKNISKEAPKSGQGLLVPLRLLCRHALHRIFFLYFLNKTEL